MTSDSHNDSPKYERVGDLVSIFQVGSVWRANFQFEGKQKRPTLKTRSKKEARRRALLLEAALQEGRYQEQVRAPAVKTVSEAYLALLVSEGKAPKTLSKCRLVMKRVQELAEQRKAKSILDINLQFVDAYRQQRALAGAKPKTLQNETVIIRQLVNFALSRSMILQDPLKNLKIKKAKRTPQPCWNRGEVDVILAACQDQFYRPALTMLAETGMRVGELKHLTWDDVDLDQGMVHIRPKEGWKPKTGDQRVIPLSTVARCLLQDQPRTCQWVFPAPASRHFPHGDHAISERRLLQYLKRVLKSVGLVGHLHTFRHSFISHALIQGIPESIVRQWVGHVDRAILQWYTHIANRDSQAAMQRLNESPTPTLQQTEKEDDESASAEPVDGSAQTQHSPPQASLGSGAKEKPSVT